METVVMVAAAVLGALVLGLAIRGIVRRRHSITVRVLSCLGALVFAGAMGMTVFVCIHYSPDSTALKALEGDDMVRVSCMEEGYLFDGPGEDRVLIFYPGGKVDAQAYAPLMSRIARGGVDCFLEEMPLRLAFLDTDRARGFMEEHSYSHVYLGGHSLGGAAAAMFAAQNGDELEGLVLMAAYSTRKLDEGLRVMCIYGDRDGVLSMESFEEYRKNLPENTLITVIPGGNHGQFGSYGDQSGDNEALISPEEQWDITAREVLELCKATE